jgi:hypothetical protein
MEENYIVIDGKRIKLSEETAKEIKNKLNIDIDYKDICDKLFKNEKYYYINYDGKIYSYTSNISMVDRNTAISREQLENLMCYNQLVNVAVYLNKDWDIKLCDQKYYHWLGENENELQICSYDSLVRNANVFFKSKKLANRATKILGEEIVMKALNVQNFKY